MGGEAVGERGVRPRCQPDRRGLAHPPQPLVTRTARWRRRGGDAALRGRQDGAAGARTRAAEKNVHVPPVGALEAAAPRRADVGAHGNEEGEEAGGAGETGTGRKERSRRSERPRKNSHPNKQVEEPGQVGAGAPRHTHGRGERRRAAPRALASGSPPTPGAATPPAAASACAVRPPSVHDHRAPPPPRRGPPPSPPPPRPPLRRRMAGAAALPPRVPALPIPLRRPRSIHPPPPPPPPSAAQRTAGTHTQRHPPGAPPPRPHATHKTYGSLHAPGGLPKACSWNLPSILPRGNQPRLPPALLLLHSEYFMAI